MDITYLGHSSFKIKTKNAILVTDPYGDKEVGMKFPKLSAEIVTISHDHGDHNQIDQVKNIRKVVEGPGEYEILEVSILGIPSFHDNKKGEERGKNVIYIIEAEGMRLAHLGDLGHKLDQGQVEDIGAIDVLMIPVGGVYTIDSTEAVEIVRMIEPKIVLPMHYKTPKHDQATFGGLEEIDTFLKELALPVENTDKLVLKGILPEEDQKIVVLAPQHG